MQLQYVLSHVSSPTFLLTIHQIRVFMLTFDNLSESIESKKYCLTWEDVLFVVAKYPRALLQLYWKMLNLIGIRNCQISIRFEHMLKTDL